jgi:hypothetical protein
MRFLPAVPLLCLLAACAPSKPTTRHDVDLASCRKNADDQFGSQVIDPADEHNPSPMAMARREELRGQYDHMVDDCMKELPPFVDAPPSSAPATPQK